MKLLKPAKATQEDMAVFHNQDYINFLRDLDRDGLLQNPTELKRFGIGGDSPAFDGVFDFSSIYTGASLASAIELNRMDSDIVINWAGGLHHAMKGRAAGFCYINDIVIAIIELLKHNERVLYVDIDVHHGDGVEKAFYNTDRVFTMSFHKWGDKFFPETGNFNDIGAVGTPGQGFALNVPLDDGIDDDTFVPLFKRLVDNVYGRYRPTAIVLQCGADSLGGDTVGLFNLTTRGHGECVAHVKNKNIPLMLLGGGGYSLNNVALCWTQETAVACDRELPKTLPFHNYFKDYTSTGYSSHTEAVPGMPNKNTRAFLHILENKLNERISFIKAPPSVQFQDIPSEAMIVEKEQDDANVENRSPNKNSMTYAIK